MKKLSVLAAAALFSLPVSAFAQIYYYAPNTTSGAYNYGSYIPAAAMPYVMYGTGQQYQYQNQYQSQYGYPYSYNPYNYYQMSYPMQYQSQSQYQYQNQYQTTYPYNNVVYSPNRYAYGYNAPNYNYTMPSYNNPSSGNVYGYVSQYPANYNYGYSTSRPQSVSYPTGTYGPFGTAQCYWSDYPTYAPCGRDPQQ